MPHGIYVSCIIAPKGCSAACISVLPNGHMRNTPSNCRAVAGFDAMGFHNCQITDCNLGSVPIFVTDVRISADKFTTLKNMSQRKRSNQLFNIICNKKGILLISHGSESIISKFRAIFPYFGLRCP
ncbi:UvrABC system protein [Trichinella spiralis]|uniref:UvrABC system protein n=1 Tax=Trichinella spiralis TaxID=6334 RepID=A0ABR3L235_TRISP